VRAYLQSVIPNEANPIRTNDYFFCSNQGGAAGWGSRGNAEQECAILNQIGVEINSAEGKKHKLRNFEPEERAPGDFVIFCEGPFPAK
jgi:hypothetical protein